MDAYATTDTDQSLDTGDTWRVGVIAPSGASVSLVATDPAGGTTSPAPVASTGEAVTFALALEDEGRYLAVVTVTLDDEAEVVPFTAYSSDPTATPDYPDVTAARGYLGETSATDAEIQGALNAEREAQRHVCEVPAAYTHDLREALLRRVARNLAARGVPIAQFTSFENGSVASRVPRTDPEVVRLEGPYARIAFA